MSTCLPKTRIVLIVLIGRMAGEKQNVAPRRKQLVNNVGLDEPTSFLDHVHIGCTQRACELNEIIIKEYREMFESRMSAGATENY